MMLYDLESDSDVLFSKFIVASMLASASYVLSFDSPFWDEFR